MQITAEAWKNYISQMSQINQKAASRMQEWINKNGLSDSKAFLDYANSLVEYYGQAVGSLACQMYEEIAAAQGVAVRTAEMADLPKYGEVAKAVNGAKKQSEKLIPSTVGRMVKQVGADTTLKNAMRDGAQFAWIPSGDTCAFCLMLASRGWQYMSKKALKNGHAEHIHANCDCQYAVRFDGKSTVQGYDPDKYLDMYYDAGGNIDEFRAAVYAENKNKINAKRRLLYAQKKNAFHVISDSDVKRVKIISTGNAEADKLICNHHKKLLEEARDRNGSKEIAYVLDKNFSVIETIYGTETDVELTGAKKGYMILHNHPNNTDHSLQDIHWLCAGDSHGISVVKNNGDCNILIKTEDFSENAVRTELKRLQKKYQNSIDMDVEDGYTKVVKDFLKDAKLQKCGLKLLR